MTVVVVVMLEMASAAAMMSRTFEIPAVTSVVGVVLRLDLGQGEDAGVKIVGLSELMFRSVEGPKVIRLFAKPLPRQGACRICAWSNILAHIPANSASGFFRR